MECDFTRGDAGGDVDPIVVSIELSFSLDCPRLDLRYTRSVADTAVYI
jgi:hypothetical protein